NVAANKNTAKCFMRTNYRAAMALQTKTLWAYVVEGSWVGTARCAVRARKAGARIPAALPPGTPQRGVPTFLCFRQRHDPETLRIAFLTSRLTIEIRTPPTISTSCPRRPIASNCRNEQRQ